MSEKLKPPIAVEPPRPRGRPRTEDLQELEARLVRVARQCFVTRGYGATSMAEVARAARASKSTLYSRFASKADLFRAILDEQIQHTGGGVRLRGPKPKALEDMLRIYAEHTLQESLSGEVLQLNRLIYSEAERFPELGEAALARGRVGVRQVAELIREYADRDDIPCRDPEAAAEILIVMLRGWYSSVMLRSRPVTAAETRTWARKMVAAFLASRPAW